MSNMYYEVKFFYEDQLNFTTNVFKDTLEEAKEETDKLMDLFKEWELVVLHNPFTLKTYSKKLNGKWLEGIYL